MSTTGGTTGLLLGSIITAIQFAVVIFVLYTLYMMVKELNEIKELLKEIRNETRKKTDYPQISPLDR